ncbi:uncharacterized protein LOC116849195 [Odontomachus brunneus]|uniref:uncharacterized protein LOC116849195 n=1 Tax=Odontomachus brunneus TaxID=486640 RepID=UPI0013F22EB8|nr:uncharacterized protein LOC116849195 [Odontomachus brunneus]
MGAYFAFIALAFREVFNVLMLKNYDYKGTLYFMLVVIYLSQIIFRFFIINYMCEKVSIKANAIADVIDRISYSTYNVEVRENFRSNSMVLVFFNLASNSCWSSAPPLRPL